MKNLLNNTRALALASVMFAAIPGTAMAGLITVDGVKDGNDAYTDSFIANWTNEHHKHGSVFNDGTDETTVWWAGGQVSAVYYLFIEAPIEAKNMIWGTGVTPAELALYDVHNTHIETGGMGAGSPHHDPLTGLDYNKATGSEKVIFGGITTELGGGMGGMGGSSLVPSDSATSHDYLLGNSICDTTNCAASTTTMSFEYAFNISTNDFYDLLDEIKNGGIEFHLSPERGGPGSPPLQVVTPPLQVPTPGTLPLMFIGMLLLFAASRRRV